MAMKKSEALFFLFFVVSANANLLQNLTKSLITKKVNISEECREDVTIFVDHLGQKQRWALDMLDSSSKIGAGISNGNFRFQGNFEQCLKIKTKFESRSIQGKYCVFSVTTAESLIKELFEWVKKNHGGVKNFNYERVKEVITVWAGICVPLSCSSDDLNNIWTQVRHYIPLPINITYRDEDCSFQDQPIPTSTTDLYIFTFFGIVLFVIVMSTMYDVYLNVKEKSNIIVPFSLYYNWQKFLSTHCENKTLTCMYGMRVLSSSWIVLGHVALVELSYAQKNLVDFFAKCSLKFLVYSAHMSVDTFFALSGILVVYVYLQQVQKNSINFFHFYLHRIIRLYPALLAAVFFHMTIAKYLSDGPLWPRIVNKHFTVCRNNSWATFLFVSNFLNKRCIGSSWYLSCDTQFYIFAPILIHCLEKHRSRTFLGIALVCLLSFLYTTATVMTFNVGFFIPEMDRDQQLLVYVHPLGRVPAWLIGACFGYLLHEGNFQLSKYMHKASLAFSLTVLGGIVWYHHVLINADSSIYNSIIMNCFSRPLWAFAVCCIIYTCSCGHGGFINSFLSHPLFVVFGKLTYSIYLTDVAIARILILNRRFVLHMTYFEFFCSFCGSTSAIVAVSLILTLCFESPIVSFLKYLENKVKEKKN